MITKDYVSAGRVVCFINLSYKSWLDDDGIPTCSTNDQSIVTVKPQYVYLKPAFQNLEKFIKVTTIISYSQIFLKDFDFKNLRQFIFHDSHDIWLYKTIPFKIFGYMVYTYGSCGDMPHPFKIFGYMVYTYGSCGDMPHPFKIFGYMVYTYGSCGDMPH